MESVGCQYCQCGQGLFAGCKESLQRVSFSTFRHWQVFAVQVAADSTAPPSTLSLSQPAGASPGQAFATQPVVWAIDSGGNLATGAPGPMLATLLLRGRPASRIVCGAATVPIYPNPFCGAAAIPLSTDAFAAPAAGSTPGSQSAGGSDAAAGKVSVPTVSALVFRGMSSFANLQVCAVRAACVFRA
jgi:hypothetical protein